MTLEQAPADRRSRNAEDIRVRSRIRAAARLRHVGAQAASTSLQRGALILAFLALIACFSFLRPATFFTLANLESTLGTQAAAALVALGVTIALLAGEYDLSVTATMGTSATVVAFLTTNKHMPVLEAVGVVIVMSIVIGLVNAFFVVKVGVTSFITTLGMATLVEGAATGLAGATTIGGVPTSLTNFFQANLFGIQRAFFFMLVVAVAFFIVLQKMPLGRKLFFTGNARTAAALAGVRVNRLRAGSLVGASLLAGLSGIMLIGQIGAASPSVADPFLLPAYAAAFLGATAFTPGRFNVSGTLVAVYLLAVGTVGFQLVGFSFWVTNVFNGAILILAVSFALLFSRRHRRPAPRSE